MQYCFNGQYGPEIPSRPKWTNEQAPFQVASADDEKVVFCWRAGARKMSIFKTDCEGCDCARITLHLTNQTTMDFLFEFSPPVVHAHFQLTLDSTPAPDTSFYLGLLKEKLCEFEQHTGYLPTRAPSAPALTQGPSKYVCKVCAHVYDPQADGEGSEFEDLPETWTCPVCGQPKSAYQPVLALQGPTSLAPQALQAIGRTRKSSGSLCPLGHGAGSISGSGAQLRTGDVVCYQLNGMNFQADASTSDVNFEFQVPSAPCMPCDVSYTVSAPVAENEYIAVGFKGLNYLSKMDEENPDSPGPPRPNYFGMASDGSIDEETTDRIALGYAGAAGSCLREMRALNYVGAPADVNASSSSLKDTSVERVSGRTVLRFTVAQHWGNNETEISEFGQFLRIMWAMGPVTAPAPTPGPSKYVCKVCAHVYDPQADGEGSEFEDLPETWTCPVCGQPKSAYQPVLALQGPASHAGSCDASLGFHSAQRGVAPLRWFFDAPLLQCNSSLVSGVVSV